MLRRIIRLCWVPALAVCAACGSNDGPAPGPTPTPTPSPTPILTTSCPQGDLIDIAIAQAAGEQSNPKVALAKDGTAWVAWYSVEGGDLAVRAQRLGRDGRPSFTASGLLVSTQPLPAPMPDFSLVVDDYGAAIVAVSESRGGEVDPYAYKLSASGAMPWGQSGVRLAGQSGPDRFPRMTFSRAGESVFAWEGFRATGSAVGLQRLSADGQTLWGSAGITVQRSLPAWANWAWVAASDGDAVILVWAEAWGPQDASPTIYARKLDGRGQAVWPADVVLAGGQINPFYDRPFLEPDGSGGVFVAWPELPHRYVQCVIQHLTAAGQATMATGGVPVSLSEVMNQLEPSLAYQSATSELLVVWSDADAIQRNRAIRAQRMTAAGVRRWGELGIELVPVTPFIPDTPRIAGARATTEGAIVVYTEQIAANASPRRVLGARLAFVDTPAWSPATLSKLVSDKGLPSLGSTRECGTWAVWQDKSADAGDIRGSFLPAR